MKDYRKSVILGIVFFLLFHSSAALETWQKSIGGIGSERGNAIIALPGGGFALTGYTSSFGEGKKDVWFIRLTGTGDTLFTRSWGGGEDDEAHSVVQTADSGFILAGYTASFGAGEKDAYLVRLRKDGDTLWTKTFGDTLDDIAHEIIVSSDGGFVFTGMAGRVVSSGAISFDYNYIYLVKVNSAGDSLWSKTIKCASFDAGHSLCKTPEGGFMITGYQSYGMQNGSPGDYADLVIVKTDSLGDTLWTRVYSGPTNYRYDAGNCIRPTSDSGFIIAGTTESFGQNYPDVFLLKTDARGDTLWTKSIGYTWPDYGHAVFERPMGGYYIAGSSIHPDESEFTTNIYLIKTDEWGDTLWSRHFGELNVRDVGMDAAPTGNGGVIVTGAFGDFSFSGTTYDAALVYLNDTPVAIQTEKPGPAKNLFPHKETIHAWDLRGRKINYSSITSPGVYIIKYRQKARRSMKNMMPDGRSRIIY
ncbi:MAG: hypothetical protein GF401_14920 [Chitinivibrionales bacterium]|nr:hypothetical protein [Chitinivibrionales bacterium]